MVIEVWRRNMRELLLLISCSFVFCADARINAKAFVVKKGDEKCVLSLNPDVFFLIDENKPTLLSAIGSKIILNPEQDKDYAGEECAFVINSAASMLEKVRRFGKECGKENLELAKLLFRPSGENLLTSTNSTDNFGATLRSLTNGKAVKKMAELVKLCKMIRENFVTIKNALDKFASICEANKGKRKKESIYYINGGKWKQVIPDENNTQHRMSHVCKSVDGDLKNTLETLLKQKGFARICVALCKSIGEDRASCLYFAEALLLTFFVMHFENDDLVTFVNKLEGNTEYIAATTEEIETFITDLKEKRVRTPEEEAIQNAETDITPYAGERLIESDVVQLTDPLLKVSDCVETAGRHFMNITISMPNDNLKEEVKDYFKTYPIGKYANNASDDVKAKWMNILRNKDGVIYAKPEKVEIKAGWINYIKALSKLFIDSKLTTFNIKLAELTELFDNNQRRDEKDAITDEGRQTQVKLKICECLSELAKLGGRTDVFYNFDWIGEGLNILTGKRYFGIRNMESDTYDITGYVKCTVTRSEELKKAEFCIGMEEGHGFMDWFDKRKAHE